MLFEIGLAAAGTYALLKGSEWITDSSTEVARRFGTTHLAIGLILVSLMLSLPEMLVSVSALLKGHENISVGVSLGSVIVNLGLVLGVTAILKPIRIPWHVVTRDGVFMLVATLVVALIALEDMMLTWRDGAIFLLLFIPYLINVYAQEKHMARREKEAEAEGLSKTLAVFGKMHGDLAVRNGLKMFIIGGIVLIIGSEMFIQSLIGLARELSITDALIGVTLGALGPSLPNLAVAIQAARKGFDDLAVSQSIGSNIFTLFVTLGVIALIRPIMLSESFGLVTAPALVIITVVSFAFMLRGRLGRKEGIILVAMYALTMAAEMLANS